MYVIINVTYLCIIYIALYLDGFINQVMSNLYCSVLYVFSGLFGGEFHRKGHILVEPKIGFHMENSLWILVYIYCFSTNMLLTNICILVTNIACFSKPHVGMIILKEIISLWVQTATPLGCRHTHFLLPWATRLWQCSGIGALQSTSLGDLLSKMRKLPVAIPYILI